MLENIIYSIIAIAIFIPLVSFAFIVACFKSQKEIEKELENMGSPSNLLVPSFFDD